MAVKVTQQPCEGDRYQFDWLLCRRGWAQLDTGADAAWYGAWADPIGLVIVQFVEGDLIQTVCDTMDELAAELRRFADWHRKHDGFKGIDPGLNPDRQRIWRDAGLADLMYPSFEVQS